MRLEVKKHVYDISEAAELIASFTAGKAFADYEGYAMLRSAVEGQFEIIGEALAAVALGVVPSSAGEAWGGAQGSITWTPSS